MTAPLFPAGHLLVAEHERCGVPWAVCWHCQGEGLTSSAGISWCALCGREWRTGLVEPCPWRAEVILGAAPDLLEDHAGTRLVCASHAAHPSAARLSQVRLHAADPLRRDS